MDPVEFDADIRGFYTDAFDEDARLRAGAHQVEFLRSQELIRRHLPTTGALRILDVGGGSGVHAEWLVDEGHSVRLLDPVPRHVETAIARLGGREAFSAQIGDARQLGEPDNAYDAVLLLGPLYHLTRREDRLKALSEALRVTTSGGIMFAAAISRFAELSSGLAEDLAFDPAWFTMMRRTLRDGQHRNPADRHYFTTSFYHHPDELESEAAEAGWHVRSLLNVEGFAGPGPQTEAQWSDPAKREAILEIARLSESEPSLRGLGPHLMLIADKTGTHAEFAVGGAHT